MSRNLNRLSIERLWVFWVSLVSVGGTGKVSTLGLVNRDGGLAGPLLTSNS